MVVRRNGLSTWIIIQHPGEEQCKWQRKLWKWKWREKTPDIWTELSEWSCGGWGGCQREWSRAPVQIQRAESTELLVPVKEELCKESGAGLIVGWEQTRTLTYLWRERPPPPKKKRSDVEWKNEGMSRLKQWCSEAEVPTAVLTRKTATQRLLGGKLCHVWRTMVWRPQVASWPVTSNNSLIYCLGHVGNKACVHTRIPPRIVTCRHPRCCSPVQLWLRAPTATRVLGYICKEIFIYRKINQNGLLGGNVIRGSSSRSEIQCETVLAVLAWLNFKLWSNGLKRMKEKNKHKR